MTIALTRLSGLVGSRGPEIGLHVCSILRSVGKHGKEAQEADTMGKGPSCMVKSQRDLGLNSQTWATVRGRPPGLPPLGPRQKKTSVSHSAAVAVTMQLPFYHLPTWDQEFKFIISASSTHTTTDINASSTHTTISQELQPQN